MIEVLLVIVGVLLAAGAGYSFVRPRDRDDVAVLESGRGKSGPPPT